MQQATQNRYYPWLIVIMNSCFLFYNYIIQVSPSVMTTELMQQFHINQTGLGNLAAVYFYSYLIVQLLLGPLYDKYSPRLLSSGALLLMSVSTYGFSQTNSLFGAYCFRLIMGAGAGFATISYLKLASLWFSKQQYGMVAGLLATAASLGAILGQAPLAYSIKQVGWHDTLYFVFLIGLSITVLFLILVKDKQKSDDSTNSAKSNEKLSFSLLLSLLKQKKVFLLALYSGLAWAPLAVIGGLWGNPFLQANYHLSTTQAASLTSFVFVGLAIGGPLSGILLKINSNKYLWMQLGLILSTLALCNLLFNPYYSILAISLSLFILGLGTGAFMLGFSLGTEWVSPALTATIIALINTGDAIFGAATEPFIGKLLDILVIKTHSTHYAYQYAMGILPLYLIIGMIILYVIQKNNKKLVY